MTEFPELQQALVHAARRRRRTPRVARPLIVALACAAIAAAAIAVTREPSDERAASPAADPFAAYGVFRHPATKADDPPSAVTGMPGLTVDQARLVERSGPWRLYLVAGSLDGRQRLCAFAVIGERSRFGCDAPGAVHGYGFPPGDGEPGGVVATVPDGIGQVEIAFAGESFGTSVAENAALVRIDPWPEGRGTITWPGGEAPLKSP